MSLVDSFLAEIRDARRPVHFAKIANTVCNALSPAELAELYQAMDLPANVEKLEAFRNVALNWSRFHSTRYPWQAKPRAFRNTAISAGARFFEDTSVRLEEKSLLVLVSGYRGRIFLPVALILDCLPKRPMDVVVLASENRYHYRDGVAGLGANLVQVAQALRERFRAKDYARVDVLGTSGGAFAALRLANLLQAENGISLGGGFPYDVLRLNGLAEIGVTAFNDLCACMQPQARRLVCAYPLGVPLDVMNAELAKLCCPEIILYPVKGQTAHAFLGSLYQNRQLEQFLELMLSDVRNPAPLSSLGFFLKGLLPRR